MTRVSGASSHRVARAPARLDRPRAAVRKQKEYKVVLEAVTDKKRKLHSILTFQDQAPRGFGFIPVGFGEVTEWCKEQCRQRGRDVHIVSAKPKGGSSHRADPEKISSHVHRIGHHFPLDVIEPACKKFGYRFSPINGLEKVKVQSQSYGVDYFERRFADYYKQQQQNGYLGAETRDYIRGAVRELFPKIPEADLSSIVNHAFKEGTDRVGNAKELSLARRVQLAVVAHIRHTYTDYDNLLKKGTWQDARVQSELPSLIKLKEWRDEEGEDDDNELEETFREIIVIDDDEHDESDDGLAPDPNVDERELSMEIVSSRATARDLQPEPIDRYQGHAPYVSRAPRRTIFLQPIQSRPSPARFTARPSYSAAPSMSYATAQASRQILRMASRPPQPSVAVESPRYRPEPFQLAHSRPTVPNREPARAPRPVEVRGSDGHLYILQPIEEPRYPHEDISDLPRVLPIEDVHYKRTALAANSKRPAPVSASPRESKSRRTSEQDMIMPSVEEEAGRSPRRVPQQYVHDRNYGPVNYARNIEPYSGYGLPQDGMPRQHAPVSMDVHRQPRMRPQQEAQSEIIDLTSSPRRPINGEMEHRRPIPLRTTGRSRNQYVLSPARESPPRDVRGPTHEARREFYESDPYRSYGGPHLPPLDRTALMEEAARFRSEGGRYLRSGADYGAYTTH